MTMHLFIRQNYDCETNFAPFLHTYMHSLIVWKDLRFYHSVFQVINPLVDAATHTVDSTSGSEHKSCHVKLSAESLNIIYPSTQGNINYLHGYLSYHLSRAKSTVKGGANMCAQNGFKHICILSHLA